MDDNRNLLDYYYSLNGNYECGGRTIFVFHSSLAGSIFTMELVYFVFLTRPTTPIPTFDHIVVNESALSLAQIELVNIHSKLFLFCMFFFFFWFSSTKSILNSFPHWRCTLMVMFTYKYSVNKNMLGYLPIKYAYRIILNNGWQQCQLRGVLPGVIAFN